MLRAVLIVVVIAQGTDLASCEGRACEDAPLPRALAQSVRRVLGNDVELRLRVTPEDRADDEAVATSRGADALVEISFRNGGSQAHLHGYISPDRGWFDRDIGFGETHASPNTEARERGRLLGFVIATMLGDESAPDSSVEDAGESEAPRQPKPVAPRPKAGAPAEHHDEMAGIDPHGRSFDFAGLASAGLRGSAAGLGASAALRLPWQAPFWGRLFIAGRMGNVPAAQATTRTAQLGGGISLSLLPDVSLLELEARFDAFATYFDATHLSDDDVSPVRHSRWLTGADVVATAGLRITAGTSALLGLGIEGVLGKTEIYTHGERVAVVPPFRAVAELGFRSRF